MPLIEGMETPRHERQDPLSDALGIPSDSLNPSLDGLLFRETGRCGQGRHGFSLYAPLHKTVDKYCRVVNPGQKEGRNEGDRRPMCLTPKALNPN